MNYLLNSCHYHVRREPGAEDLVWDTMHAPDVICVAAAKEQLRHCHHRVYQHRVVLAENQSRRDRVKAERFAEGPGPLAYHSLSRGGENVHTKRGLFRSLCAIHLGLLSISERVTVRGRDWQKRDGEAQSPASYLLRGLTVLEGGAAFSRKCGKRDGQRRISLCHGKSCWNCWTA